MSSAKHRRQARPCAAGAARARVGAELGAVTLIVLALSAVVVVVAYIAADLGALEVARAQAQTAADLAALAAVTPAGGGTPAGRAREIAAANGADVTRCTCEPMEAVIGVRRRVLLAPFAMPVEVTAYARAVLPAPGAMVLQARRPSRSEAHAGGQPSGIDGEERERRDAPASRAGATSSARPASARAPPGGSAVWRYRLLDPVSSPKVAPDGTVIWDLLALPHREGRLRHLGGARLGKAGRARGPVQLVPQVHVLAMRLVEPSFQVTLHQPALAAPGPAAARRAPCEEEEEGEQEAETGSHHQELALREVGEGSVEELDRT